MVALHGCLAVTHVSWLLWGTNQTPEIGVRTSDFGDQRSVDWGCRRLDVETPSLPALSRSYPCHFAFYVAHPIRSIRLLREAAECLRHKYRPKASKGQAQLERRRLFILLLLSFWPPSELSLTGKAFVCRRV